MKPRICFSLLNYKKSTHRHYLHIYEFIEALAQRTDLRLLISTADETPEFLYPSSTIDLTGRGLKSRLRRYFEIIRARMDGYRIFYHHYTTDLARCSAVINHLTGGKTFLWHCIVMDALDQLGRRGFRDKFILKLTLRIIHHLVTGSTPMAKSYADRYGIKMTKIRVVPNYLNLKRFNPESYDRRKVRSEFRIPDNRKVIMYLHELEEGRAKHLPTIVEGLFKKRNDCVFLIVGDGRYRAFLENRLQEYTRNNTVIFAGSVPNFEVPWFYAAADVYIMVSDFEAFSRVLLESMAMGIPYVATDGSGNIRAYTPPEHQPFILPTTELSDFVEKVCNLLDDTQVRETFIRAGYENAQKYSLESVLDTFMKTVLIR